MTPHHWNRTAANNGSADPNADLRPNRSANTVVGAVRGLMATAASARDDGIGLLTATLGAGNVYSVSTNEGLIDITTGINGVPAAITAPFLLRLAFDTPLTGSAATAPHLKVDGFDCGPILRRDGSALQDGDLVKVRSVLVRGEMAAGTDTKVTQVRVLDEVLSDAKARGLIFSGFPTYGSPLTSVALTAADCGHWINFNGTVAGITLPPLSTVQPGQTLLLLNTTPGRNIALSAAGADQIFDGIGYNGSINLAYTEDAWLEVRDDGTAWCLVGGATHDRFTVQLASSLGASGFKNIPDKNSPTGFITRIWGSTLITAGANVAQPVPLIPSFPNAIMSARASSSSVGTSAGAARFSPTQILVFASNNGAAVDWEAWGY